MCARLAQQPLAAALTTAWNEPDQYEWITAFLRERGMLIWARRMNASVAASAALIPVTVLICERAPLGFLIVQVIGLVLASIMAVLWLRRWPTRLQSQTAVLFGLVCIAVWSQAQHNHEQAIPICMAAAITGGYIAFYHGTRLMIVNFVVALGLNAVTVYRLADATEVMSAARAFWLIWLFNMTVPLSAWGAIRSIRAYVTRSNEDPLTGLLNRRAFTPAVLARLTLGTPDPDSHLIIAMIDLDNFKNVNDTYGHATGDNLLIAVADLLRHNNQLDTPLCRAGGEEFLIAQTASNPEHSASWATHTCEQIATLTPPVTASIGTISVALAHTPLDATTEFIEQLIRRADDAMYTAKRNGGNHAHHTTHEPAGVKRDRI